MTKTRVWLSVLTAGAAVGALAFSFNRRAQRATRPLPSVRASQVSSNEIAPSDSAHLARQLATAGPEPRIVAIDVTHDGEPTPTVQCSVKMPAPLGADDAEALEPDEIGSDWLSRATQSERSLREADLDVDLENLAEVLDDAEPMTEDFDEIEV